MTRRSVFSYLPKSIKQLRFTLVPVTWQWHIEKCLHRLGLGRHHVIYYALPVGLMDRGFLGIMIRHYSAYLDRVTRYPWTLGRGVDECSRTCEALAEWRRRGYPESEDIRVVDGLVKNFTDWQKSKKAVEPKGDGAAKSTDLLTRRRSVRKFQRKTVEKRLIETVLEAGRWAPSACNRQTWTFVVKESRIPPGETPISFPPVMIYVAIDERPYYESYGAALDAGAIVQNMLLKIEELNLGAYWMYQGDSVDQRKIQRLLGLSSHHYVYSVVYLGYPGESVSTPARKPVSDNTLWLGQSDNEEKSTPTPGLHRLS